MKRSVLARRRSRRLELRPAFLWLSLTLLLLACSVIGLWSVYAVMGDWLELKLDSARYHVIEILPQPERPDFVPTPILVRASAGTTPQVWVAQAARRAATATPFPTKAASPTASLVVPTEITQPQAEPPTAEPPPTNAPAPVTGDSAELASIQPSVQLTGVIPEAQRFNNCGPTTLRMYFSFFGFTKDTQVQIANAVKPYKDDRNVSPDELTDYAAQRGFRAIARVNGDLERVKLILSNQMPVMIEEGYDPPRAHQGWMGHYLLITGYDGAGITAQDSYNGPNQRVTWQDLDDHWRDFNRTYILVYPEEKDPVVRAILGEDIDDATMYAKAAQRAQEEWNASPQDPFAVFNLGSSLVGLGENEAAANAFDQARQLKLPWRMLWYQFGPYEAYTQVGRYDEVIALADATLKPTGDLEESYYYKAVALFKLGKTDDARRELESALKYNPNYNAAREALKNLGL